MGWHSNNEEFRADHCRDLRKHDTLPHRLDVEIDGAVEVAIAVKNCPTIEGAAGLIEAYVQSEFQRVRLEAVAAGARP